MQIIATSRGTIEDIALADVTVAGYLIAILLGRVVAVAVGFAVTTNRLFAGWSTP